MPALRPFLLLLLVTAPATAVDTLRVGGGRGLTADWDNIVETSRFVGVQADSVWTWSARANTNLALDALQRGGRIAARVVVFTPTGTAPAVRNRQGIERWIDGDAATAWSPQDDVLLPGDAETAERRTDFYIDLGATFRVHRIRLFPRLDVEHRGLILGRFEVATADDLANPIQDAAYRSVPGMSFTTFAPNRQPVVEATFARRDVRVVRLRSTEGEPWEIAEFEIYAEGTVPAGEVVSQPLFVRGGFPIWGTLSWDGGNLNDLAATVQTRTGPDDEPLFYYLQRGDELEQVSRRDYETFTPLDFAGAAQVERGPILPNPAWSTWQTVADGQVLSPAPRRFLQFRLQLPDPGTRVQSLFFEYVGQPLAGDLIAEVAPLIVDAGVDTEFTLSMEIRVDVGRGDTGFRYIEVRTPATVRQVHRVLVDDEEVLFTPSYDEDGFVIDIWDRIIQSGTFIQVEFTALVLSDGATFEVRARDSRPVTDDNGRESVEAVYQTARPGDIDPLSPGGELVVRLRDSDVSLVSNVQAAAAFSPNGDGINDVFEISYDLLKVTQPVPVAFEIFDLSGRRIAQGSSDAGSGRFARIWSGQTMANTPAPPGIYLFRVRAAADVGERAVIGVARLVR